MGPYGVPGLPPTKPQPSTNPPCPCHISIFHTLSATQTHTQTYEHIHTHMHLTPRVFWPLIPLMVINLEPVSPRGVLHISTKCVLESPFLSYLPRATPSTLTPRATVLFHLHFPLRAPLVACTLLHVFL